jgi:hypothetical protein
MATAQRVSGSVSAEESTSSDSTVSAAVLSEDSGQLTQPSNGSGHGSAPKIAGYRQKTIAVQRQKITAGQHVVGSLGGRGGSTSQHTHAANSKTYPASENPKELRMMVDQSTSPVPGHAWAAEADQDAAGSSETMPDSTRGTGVVNPADPGTSSPLEWSPGFNFGFADISKATFLNPTLHVEEHSKKGSAGYRSARSRAASALNTTPKSPLPSLLNGAPLPGVLSQSALHSTIRDPLSQP